MLKILQARLQQYINHELPDVQAGYRKNRGTRNKLQTSFGSSKKREFLKTIYFFFTDYAKALDCVDQNKLWKFLKRWEDQNTYHAFWEICMHIRKQQLDLDMEQQTGSK